MSTPADEGVSTDDLSAACGLAPGALAKAMADLETLGLSRNDVAMTVFVHVGVANASPVRLAVSAELEVDLIQLLQELAPEADDRVPNPLHLAETCQRLRDRGHPNARPDNVDKLLRGIARDGRGQDGGKGNISLRTASRNTLLVTLERPWRTVAQTAELRRTAAGLLLEHLIGRLDKGVRGKDLQVDTTVGDLLAQLTQDAFLSSSGIRDMTKLLERSLLWLHEQDVAVLGKGLTVFRPAMTICLNPRGGSFTQADFAPLEDHYAEQTLQTHVMATYAETGLNSMADAARLSEDYFLLNKDQFLRRWMPGKAREIRRQTTGESWKSIVEDLGNRTQQDIVTDDRDRTNVLILAGPGSGKTRVLVHRIAYLLRVKREDPRGILVLAYNRHAAAEIRSRLRELVGDDAVGVTISTCHALAMKLVGASFAGMQAASEDFDTVVMEAVRQLNPEGLTKSEAEAQRESLIQGYRWILVDEYQDIGSQEYAMIAAVAGRTLEDAELKLSLFAVGDDDQNVYAFRGASVDYIRKFEADYKAKPTFLVENYRSTAGIIAASNHVISKAPGRMKRDNPIRINSERVGLPAGGRLTQVDTVAQGRVQLLDVPPGEMAQAAAAVDELRRLSRLDPDWNWNRAAVISRTWHALNAVRSYAEAQGIKVEMANEDMPNIWRLRETQRLVVGLRQRKGALLGIQDIIDIPNEQPGNKWISLLAEGIADLARELNKGVMPVPDIIEWIAEWARDTRGQQGGLLLLTAHRAKGLEFDHVVILNGDWRNPSRNEDPDAPRRLFYVAMTRARHSLTVLTNGPHQLIDASAPAVLHRRVANVKASELPVGEIYALPNLGLVDLSYAGRLNDGNESLTAIRDAKVSDPLKLISRKGKWILIDGGGRLVGRMANSWQHPEGYVFDTGKIGAIVIWRKVDNKEEFQGSLRRDSWETILPELVFRPLHSEVRQKPPVAATKAKGQIMRLADDKAALASGAASALSGAPQNNLALLETIVRDALSGATSWATLVASLETKGLTLGPKGGGLVLMDAKSGTDTCKLSAIGFRYLELIRKFGEGFPGHPANWLVECALKQSYTTKALSRSRKVRKRKSSKGGDDLTLVED